jgi:lipopolysaccharide export LptBFGC system permease protein LptF
LSLGYGEMLPPIIAAWMANVVFLSFGVFILMRY